MKNTIFPLALVPFCLIIFIPFAEAQKTAAEKPNVIIIFADDMGYGDVSGLNPAARTATPHIDKLAQHGIVFTNAHASASVCTPSRYGLLTGRYAWRSASAAGVCNGFSKPVIAQGRTTVANLFKNAGYTTACIGKWHLGVDWQTKDGADTAMYNTHTGYSNVDYTKKVAAGPNSFGFDYSFIHPASLDMPPYVFLRNHMTIDPEVVLTSDVYPDRLDDTEYAWDKKHTGEHDVYWQKGVWWRRGEISRTFKVENCLTEIMEDGISFIEKQSSENPSQPFFLYLPLTGPHTPWMPTDQFKGKSPIGTYGDFIMDIDHVVEQVTATLQQLGIDNNTLIIFSSDNGAYWPQEEVALQNHDANWGRRGQKGDVWDGGHRVPLIISWPARIKNQVIYDHLVSLTDMFATFADLTNQPLQPNTGEDSFSFFHVLQGNNSKATRPAMIHQSSGGMYSIRTGEWKLINGLGSGGFTVPNRTDPVPGGPIGQLYQINTDTLESTNVFLQHPEIIKKLEKALNEKMEQGHSRLK